MFLKLEKCLFYVFLFCIPFETRKILWYSDWRFNEWLSVSVYLTDILLAVLFIFWFLNSYQKNTNPKFQPPNKFEFLKSKLKTSDPWLVIFLTISLISIKNSTNITVSWYQWFKLVEFVVFYFYISRYALAKFDLYKTFLAILSGGVFQALIAMTQLFKQSSLGLKYLGESVLNKELAGVASFYLQNGDKFIRAYGTTPHPNVLAGSLFLSIFAFYFVYLYSKIHVEHSPLSDNWDKFFILSYGVILFGFFATFSRVVIFIWFITFCIRGIIILSRKHYRIIFGTDESRQRIKAILIAGFVVILLFGSIYFKAIITRSTINPDDQAVELRGFYNKVALMTGGGINFLGVGAGNFVNWLMEKQPMLPNYAYQPVHNIYLLIYSETGLLGLTAFILFLYFLLKDFILKTKLSKSYQLSVLFFFISVLFIGFFDHFLMTLQQGRIVFWFSAGLLTHIKNSDII